MNSLKESYRLWKNKNLVESNFCLQRFILPDRIISKFRIFYNIQKNQMTYKVITNDSTNLEVPMASSKGWVRLNQIRPIKTPTTADVYLVRNANEAGNYDMEVYDEKLSEQLKQLRRIIEALDGSYTLNELVADFLHDKNKAWYFLNVVNYKTEFMIEKKKTKSLPKIRNSIKTLTTLERNLPDRLNTTELIRKPRSSKELLAQEAILDLQPSESRVYYTSEEIYCKAYHLKPK